ncbi:hypothetical protein ABIE00_004714 [Arthrobacter sp. OAP107]
MFMHHLFEVVPGIMLDAGHQPGARHGDHRLAQGGKAVRIEGVARGCGDGFVEFKVRLHGVCRVFDAVREVRQCLPQGVQLPFRPVSGGQRCRFGFDADPEFQQVQPILGGDHSPGGLARRRTRRGRGQRKAAPPAFGFHEALGLEAR